MSFETVLVQMAVLFLMLAVGYAARKLKVFGPDGVHVMTALVMNITLPCMILNSILNGGGEISGGETLRFLGMSALAYVLMFLLSWVTPAVLRVKADAGIYRFAVMFANTGFMGFPVIEALYGREGLFFAALYNILFNVLAYSLGIRYISGSEGRFNWKKIVNPAVVTTLFAIVLHVLHVQLPEVLMRPIELMGNVTTPVSMIVVGATLANMPLRDMFSGWRIYPLTAITLLVVPLITWAIFRWFVPDAVQLAVLVLLAAMPAASATTMICLQYGGNEELASKVVFLTTLLSVVTVPAVVYALL